MIGQVMGSLTARGFKQLALANWRELLRDPKTLLYIIVPPVAIACFFLFFTVASDVSRTVTVIAPAVADSSVRSTISVLQQMPKMKIDLVDEQKGKDLKQSGQYEAIVTLPPSLENNRITVEARPGSKVPVWLIQSLLTEATRKAGSPAILMQATGDNDTDPRRSGVPGTLIYAMASLALFGIATPLVNMRQRGTLRLLGTTPVSRLTLILAQVPTRLVIAMAMVLVALIYTGIQFPVSFGNLVAAFGTALLGFFMLASIGYLVGSAATSNEAATNSLAFLLPIAMMASGVIMPLEIMPEWFQTLSRFIPLTYLGDAMRQELAGGRAHTPMWADHLVIVATALGCTYVAVRSFRWDQDEAVPHRAPPAKRTPHSTSR